MQLRLLKPDATKDGKIVFSFLDVANPTEPILITSEPTALTKTAIKAAKNDAIAQAKVIAKDKADKKTKREKVLAALVDAGIGEEEITE